MTLSTVRGSVNILQQRNVSQHSSQLKKEPPGVGRTLLFSAGLLNSCPSRQCWGRQTLCGALAPAHSRWCHSLLMAIINITLCAHQMKMQTPRIALAPEVDTCSAVPRHTFSIHHHVCVRVGACAPEIESVIRSAAMFPKCWNEKWCRSRNPYKRRVRACACACVSYIHSAADLVVCEDYTDDKSQCGGTAHTQQTPCNLLEATLQQNGFLTLHTNNSTTAA